MIGFLRERFNERSTWLLIGAGVAAASELREPWSIVSVVVATIAALIPDGPLKR
jgi:hypothetical protein